MIGKKSRRDILRTVLAVAVSGLMVSPSKAERDQTRPGDKTDIHKRPDMKIINNTNGKKRLKLELGLPNSNVNVKKPMILQPNQKRKIRNVLLPKEGNYKIKANIGGELVGRNFAESPNGTFPDYLTVVVDIREGQTTVATTEV